MSSSPTKAARRVSRDGSAAESDERSSSGAAASTRVGPSSESTSRRSKETTADASCGGIGRLAMAHSRAATRTNESSWMVSSDGSGARKASVAHETSSLLSRRRCETVVSAAAPPRLRTALSAQSSSGVTRRACRCHARRASIAAAAARALSASTRSPSRTGEAAQPRSRSCASFAVLHILSSAEMSSCTAGGGSANGDCVTRVMSNRATGASGRASGVCPGSCHSAKRSRLASAAGDVSGRSVAVQRLTVCAARLRAMLAPIASK
eukprot:5048511-Pleurochrysis_carterae.AAC.4